MMNCENFNFIGKDPVNDPVVLHNDLSKVPSTDLRDNMTRTREICKVVCGSEHTLGEQFCISRRVASNEQTNRIEVVQGLVCPGYLSHRAIRLRASS